MASGACVALLLEKRDARRRSGQLLDKSNLIVDIGIDLTSQVSVD
jgi:hypothetical protein